MIRSLKLFVFFFFYLTPKHTISKKIVGKFFPLTMLRGFKYLKKLQF